MENPKTGIPKLGGVPSLNTNAPGGLSLGTGFNLQNLENLNEIDSPRKVFSWTNEFETILDHTVTSKDITEEIDSHLCKATITTLENESFNLQCSMAKGIKVLETNSKGDFINKVYESLEGFLMRASPLYIKAVTSA